MKKYISLTLLLFLALSTFNITLSYAQDDKNAPYVYYFSLDRMAWVIERADGTDTHVIGAGLVEKPTDRYTRLVVDGPGWSSSGEWLAFTTQEVGMNYTPLARRPHVINVNGQDRLTEIESLQDAQLAWSPTHDWLLVTADYVVQNLGSAYLQSTLWLMDVGQHHIIYQRETRTPVAAGGFYEPNQPTLRWTADGQYAIVEAPHTVSDIQSTQVTILDGQGHVTTKTFAHVLYPYSDSYWNTDSPISVQGDLIYQTPDGSAVAVENLITGRQVTFDQAVSDSVRPYWSPDGHYVLLSGNDLRLISLTDTAADLAVIQDTLTAPISSVVTFHQAGLWSPNSQGVVFYEADEGVYYLDAATHRLTLLQPSDQAWANNWVWLPNRDSQLILSVPSSENVCCSTFRYDFTQNIAPVELIDYPAEWFYYPPVPSEDGHYLGAVNEGAQIYDRQTQQLMSLRPDADGYYSDNSGWIEWHGDWFMIFEGALVASGGDGGSHIGLGNVDGTRRELTYSRTAQPTIIAGWLPSQVDVAQLAPPITPRPQPVQVYHSNHWNFRVSWSPDGQQVAGGLDLFLAGGAITIWSTVTHEALHDFENIYADYGFKNWARVTWEAQSDTTYQPVLVDTPLADPQRFPYATAVSADGQWTVAQADEGLAVLDSTTGEVIHLLDTDNWGDLMSASFSPDRRYLALGYGYVPGVIFDTQTWQIIATLPATSPGLAFSPDGQYLALGVSWDVEIWRVNDLIGGDAED